MSVHSILICSFSPKIAGSSMADLISCSIGVSLDDHCYAGNINSKRNIKNFDDEKKKLLKLWWNLEVIHSVCNYHEKVYLGRFVSDSGKFCCDPFNGI